MTNEGDTMNSFLMLKKHGLLVRSGVTSNSALRTLIKLLARHVKIVYKVQTSLNITVPVTSLVQSVVLQ